VATAGAPRYKTGVTPLLIDPAELTHRMRTRDVIVIDARPASAFAAAHLPGAVHLDLFGMSLVDTRPAPLKAFEWMVRHLFELRGLTREQAIAVYEEDSGMRAARVVWLLQLFGHPTRVSSTAAFAAGATKADRSRVTPSSRRRRSSPSSATRSGSPRSRTCSQRSIVPR